MPGRALAPACRGCHDIGLPQADLLQNPDSGDASYLVSAVALAGFLDPALWTQRVFGHEGNRLSPLSARELEG